MLAIDPATDKVEKIDVGATAHWVAVSHATGKVFASVKQDYVAVVDRARRTMIDRIKLPQVVEGLAISPDGGDALCLRADRRRVLRHRCGKPRVCCARSRSRAPTRRRSRCGACGCRPTTRYVVVSSNQDHHAAIYQADGLRQIASFPTKKSPMGFGFAADGKHAYLCCHDDAEVFEFELATGRVTRTFPTAAGCEFIVGYH